MPRTSQTQNQIQATELSRKALSRNPSFGSVPDNPLMDEILDLEGAALLCKVKKKTIYSWVHQNVIPYSKPNGGKLIFFRSELVAWLKSCRNKTNCELMTEAEKQLLDSNRRSVA